MFDINDPSVYDDNYTILSKIRKILKALKDLINRVTSLENKPDYSLPTATSNRLGGIKVGENLTVEEDGTLNASGGGESYTLPTATDTRLGGIKVGQNLTVEEDGTLNATGGGGGGYTLPTATSSRLGGIKVGSHLSVQEDGTLSADDQSYSLPTASASTLGGVKVGQNLSIDENGVLNATGGGGSSLTGEIKLFEGHFTKTYNQSSGGIKSQYMVTSAEAGSIPLNFVDIKKINTWPCSDVQTINGIINVIDSSDTTNITIPQIYSITGFKPERVYKSGNAVVNGANAYTVNLEGTLTLSFNSGGSLWYVSGKGLLNLVWNYSGNIQVGNLNMEISTFHDSTNNKSYSGPQGVASTVSYWGQYGGLTMDHPSVDIVWDGYYVS